MRCSCVIFVVRGQELLKAMERGCILSLTRGVLRYVRNYNRTGMTSDCLHLRSSSQWLHLIVQNRPGNADVADINDINDIRNGVFSAVAINRSFDRRRLAILKV